MHSGLDNNQSYTCPTLPLSVRRGYFSEMIFSQLGQNINAYSRLNIYIYGEKEHSGCPKGIIICFCCLFISSVAKNTPLHTTESRMPLPHRLVRQPACVTVVIAVVKGGLQLCRRGYYRRVLQTHTLGVGEGESIAVVRSPVMEHHP